MNLIERLEVHQILFLCHQNTDPDALCSAYVFSRALKRLNKRLRIWIAAEEISRTSDRIREEVPIRIEQKPRLNRFDLFILFDTNTFKQLGGLGDRVLAENKPIVVIDHHAVNAGTKKRVKLQFVDENARSTCELVYSLLEEENVEISKREALCLFYGVAYDTRHFALANAETFKTALKLIEKGVNPEKALAVLVVPPERSERIARLKAAQRCNVLDMNNWIVAFSKISSHQASCARGLISLGADIAVVGGEKDGELRISMRATEDFLGKTGLHLGRDLAQPLGELMGGAGGGHSGAAGINGGQDVARFFRECEAALAKKLKD